MKKTYIGVLIGLALLISSGVLLVNIIRSQQTSLIIPPPSSTQSFQPSQTTKPTISGEPVSINIPSLNINLPITPGYYNATTKTWTLTIDKVQYAVMTPEPNNFSGDTFLYGHYRSNVFASLHTVKSGAEAIVTTANGHNFYYLLNSITVVSPNDSASVFDYTGRPILTVQTCTGLFFQNRQLFTFDLEKVV